MNRKKIELSKAEMMAMGVALTELESAPFEGAMHRELSLALRDKLYLRLSDAHSRAYTGRQASRSLTVHTHEASILVLALLNPHLQFEECRSVLGKLQPMLMASEPKPSAWS